MKISIKEKEEKMFFSLSHQKNNFFTANIDDKDDRMIWVDLKKNKFLFFFVFVFGLLRVENANPKSHVLFIWSDFLFFWSLIRNAACFCFSQQRTTKLTKLMKKNRLQFLNSNQWWSRSSSLNVYDWNIDWNTVEWNEMQTWFFPKKKKIIIEIRSQKRKRKKIWYW